MTQKARSAAQGLASLGRHGDSTLVHMSPREVAGLQNLARAHGTSLTVNPRTGMPEAFNLESLLPTLGGIALGIVAPWSIPYVAAGTAGAMKASGKDWGESLLTGLQVYGGGQLAAGLGAAGSATAPTTEAATATIPNATATVPTVSGATATDAVSQAANQLTTGVPGASALPAPIPAPTDAISQAATDLTTSVPGGSAMTNPYVQQASTDTFANTGINASNAGTDLSSVFPGQTEAVSVDTSAVPGATKFTSGTPTTTPFDTTQALTKEQLAAGKEAYMNQAGTMGERASAFNRGVGGVFDPSNKAVTFGNTFGNLNTPAQIGVGTGIASGFVEEPKDTTPEKPKPVYYIGKDGKPLYTQGTVNPNVARLGYIPQGESYFQGQQFNPGVYSYSYDKYEPVPGMRRGGSVGIRHLLGGGQLSQNTANNIVANSGTAPQPTQPSPNQMAMQSANQYFQNQAANVRGGPMMQAPPSSQAMNDYLAQGNQMITPVERPAYTQGLEGAGTDTRLSNLQTAANKYDFEKSLRDMYNAEGDEYGDGKYREAYGHPANAYRKSIGGPYIDENGNIQYQGNQGKYWSADAPAVMSNSDAAAAYDKANNMASGGLANLGGTYKAGGKLLRGPGDGMSDSIPAVIGGHKPQRAALADGEFVIPADVVSHLGNGSTEAGSRKLYAMMDKIRHARTGRKKQAPAIKAERFMPR